MTQAAVTTCSQVFSGVVMLPPLPRRLHRRAEEDVNGAPKRRFWRRVRSALFWYCSLQAPYCIYRNEILKKLPGELTCRTSFIASLMPDWLSPCCFSTWIHDESVRGTLVPILTKLVINRELFVVWMWTMLTPFELWALVRRIQFKSDFFEKMMCI